ncbi:hypothetical protein XENTR_v10019465 [Xenopus tropicalis]|nr:hypothetical protein XENTR_v10019465 [Xenopus tropicalis]
MCFYGRSHTHFLLLPLLKWGRNNGQTCTHTCLTIFVTIMHTLHFIITLCLKTYSGLSFSLQHWVFLQMFVFAFKLLLPRCTLPSGSICHLHTVLCHTAWHTLRVNIQHTFGITWINTLCQTHIFCVNISFHSIWQRPHYFAFKTFLSHLIHHKVLTAVGLIMHISKEFKAPY